MNQITAAVVYTNMTVLHSSGKSVSSIQHLFHTRLVICACIPLYKGSWEIINVCTFIHKIL